MPASERPRAGHRPALVVALLVFVLAGAALGATHHALTPAVPRALAVRAALVNGRVRTDLAGVRPDRTIVTAVDRRLVRVEFFLGSRLVEEAAVGPGGAVVQVITVAREAVPYGDWIAYEPAVIAFLGALFVLMLGVTPWRRLRNLDVAAMLSLVAPALLLQHLRPDASVLAGLPGLVYLLARCGWRALGPSEAAATARGQTALWSRATASLEPRARVRLLWMLCVALALVLFAVGVSSEDPVDVLVAVMEGATRIAHGVLPYGHMPGDIIHGDTYPPLTYLAYVPLALLTPVGSSWDSVDLGLAAAVLVGVLAAAGIAAGVRRRGAPDGATDGREAGLRAAVVWLCFPPVLLTVSTGTTDVALGALLLAAVLVWRRPAWASGLLTAATWFKLAPALLMPFALAPLRGRLRGRALLAVLVVSAPVLAAVLALGGPAGVLAMTRAIAFQFTRGSNQSLWAVLGIGALQPIGEAAVVAFVAGAAWRLRYDRALAGDPARIAALCAAVLIGLQLSADYWSFLYLSWFAPLLMVSLLVPAPRGALAQSVPVPLGAGGARVAPVTA